MTDKMSGKQKIAGTFDLSKFVGGADPDLYSEVAVRDEKLAPQPRTIKKRAGGPKPEKIRSTAVSEPQKEMLTERVQVKLTQEEMDRLKEATGLVPVSVYLRKFLKDKGLV